MAAFPWSPLRPKSIQHAVDAAANEASAGAGAQHWREATTAAASAADDAPGPAFELPENVARHPAGGGRAAASDVAATGAAMPYWLRKRRRGITDDGAAAAVQPQPKRLRLPKKFSGPERAAARRRRQQLAKRAVNRRVALWRTRLVDGEKETVYITLGGDVMVKSGKAYRIASADQKYLKSRGIVSHRPTNSSIEVPQDLQPYARLRSEDPLDLSYWSLPESVQAGYRDVGVRRLHRWQAECLSSPQVLEGRSLVYVAPTSAGKSLVSEILILRQLLFRGRRALLVLPYVSICVERVEYLRRVWAGCGVRVEALHSASDGKWHPGADVAVCTIEKASALLNKLLEDDALLGDIGVLVIDEMHILGEEQRGYLLENILVKARLSTERAGLGSRLQIVGLSATMPNVDLLSNWLGAHLYIGSDRPVPLSLSVASKGRVLPAGLAQADAAVSGPLPAECGPRDPDGLTPLVWECISGGHAVLIFCATKNWCEKAAAMLADELPVCPRDQDMQPPDPSDLTGRSESIMDRRLQLLEELRQAPSGLCPILAVTILRGVAYHHADLTVEERSLLETAYRKGVLGCLCATSTLAAGVNLPARRVIIRSMKVGNAAMDAVRFRQMAGRAGRVGLDTKGECIVLAKGSKDADEARTLFSAELNPIVSSMNGQRLARAVLEVICLGLVRSVRDLEDRFARSLLRFRAEQEPEQQVSECQTLHVPAPLLEDIRGALKYLEEHRLVRIDSSTDTSDEQLAHPPEEATLLATPLGDGVVHSALRPSEALGVFEDLQRSRKGLCLDTDLHLIFLATPLQSGIEPDWQRYIRFYERLKPRDRAVATAVGVSHDFLMKQSMGHRGPVSTSTTSAGMDWRQQRERVTALHRRFWSALALRELAAEVPARRVASSFGAPRGALQSLQSVAATYCGMVRQLCERLRWHEFAALFDSLLPRINFGVSPECLSLCRVPGLYPARARAFFEAGFTNMESVAKASVSDIEAVLRKLGQFESHCTDAQAARHQEVVIRQTAQKIVRGAQERLGEEIQNLEDEAEAEQLRVKRTQHVHA